MSAAKSETYGKCKCCHKETYLKNMWFTGKDQQEVYGQMLIDCFSIDWMIQGDLEDDKICGACVDKLRLAVNFKNQVLKSQAGILQENNASVGEEDVEEQVKKEEEEEEESLNENGDQTEEEEEGTVVEFLEEELLAEDNDDSQDWEPAEKKAKWPKKLPRSERNRQKRQYADEDLKRAVEAVKAKEMNTMKAAEVFNVPRKTISNRIYDNTDGENTDQPPAQDDMESLLGKHRDNIRSILVSSNATPIKGHWGFGYACFFCPKQFAEPFQLKQHTFKHGSLIPCVKVKSLTEHIVKLDVTDLKCNICDGKKESLDDLMTHLKYDHKLSMHLDIPNHIVPFSFANDVLKCVKCPKTFDLFKNLSEHMNDAHYRNYECVVCRRGFVNVRALKTHCISHGINIFTCTFCPKVFDSRTEMTEHEKQVHLKIKDAEETSNVITNETRKSASPKKIKAAVEKRTADEKLMETLKNVTHFIELDSFRTEHKCRSCPKVFESRSDLLYHINSNHKPHKCPDCDCTFDFQFKLKQHLVRQHAVPSKRCSKCPKIYLTENVTEEPEQQDLKEYSCEVCCTSFSEEDSYLAHMKNDHGLEE